MSQNSENTFGRGSPKTNKNPIVIVDDCVHDEKREDILSRLYHHGIHAGIGYNFKRRYIRSVMKNGKIIS